MERAAIGHDTGALLTIDIGAIVANWRLLAARTAPAACAAVLKSNAYGLGASRIAPALAAAGCRIFFVALLSEAASLRPHLPADATLVVLNGALPGTEPDFVASDITPVINSIEQLAGWSSSARQAGRSLPLWLQLDTGMARFGLAPRDVDMLANDPGLAAGLAPAMLMSHLAIADRPDRAESAAQSARFDALHAALAPALGPMPASLAASSGIFLDAHFHRDLVRPGAALYGVAPNAAAANPMHQVVTLHAPCVQTRRIAPGDTVGYGATWTATRPTCVATIACGYADGFLRAGSNRAAVAWMGVVLPVIGLVSMDCITVDATALGEATLAPGDMVELIGPTRTLEKVAADAGTIAYEILTALGPRHRRRHVMPDGTIEDVP